MCIRDSCNCGKNYKHASSLWNHKTKCTYTPEKKDNIDMNKMCSNQEMKKMCREIFLPYMKEMMKDMCDAMLTHSSQNSLPN